MPEAALHPGARFGDYEILAELGAGGMGRVYRARDLTLERLVALKMLAPQYGNDPGFVQRFLKEARTAARLNHPNIVQIYGFGCISDLYYLAMEYVDGYSLGAYLRRGPFPEEDAVLIVRHAARALGIAHAEGLVHRDIKPDNIMLTAKGVVKIVDLGIAKQVGEDQSLTQTGLAVGTPHYISPEQVRGAKDVDGRADIYSLGATLYHLLTGHPPYEGDSSAVVMSMHLVEPLPDPRTIVPGLSEGVCRVIDRMMAKRREERYADVNALDRDLYRVQSGDLPEADEPTGRILETVAEFADAAPPRATPTSAPAQPAFDSSVLHRIEDALAADVGPMARVLVRRVARSAPTLDALCGELAEQVPAGEARDSFRAKCLLAARGADRPPTPPLPVRPERAAPSMVPVSSTPVARTTPGPAASLGALSSIPEGELRLLESELARHVGPLARVFVKKAAKGATSASAIVPKLEAEIPSEEGRRAFRAAVRNLR